MRGTFRIFIILLFLCLIPFGVLAEDTSQNTKNITLTINWLEDTPEDRPQEITIELYRTVDDEEIPMDSQVLTSKNAISENTWEASFPYVYGQVWEYAFKILGSQPKTALYAYQLIESGNGTNHYTFDYFYGRGSTEMNIVTHWEDNQAEDRPDQVSIDIVSLDSGNVPERSIILTGDKNEDAWSATVTGLKEAASNYYLIENELPERYASQIDRGEKDNSYVITNTLKEVNTPEDMNTVDKAVSGVAGTVDIRQIQSNSLILTGINCLSLVLLVLTSVFAINKHRQIAKKRSNRRRDNG